MCIAKLWLWLHQVKTLLPKYHDWPKILYIQQYPGRHELNLFIQKSKKNHAGINNSTFSRGTIVTHRTTVSGRLPNLLAKNDTEKDVQEYHHSYRIHKFLSAFTAPQFHWQQRYILSNHLNYPHDSSSKGSYKCISTEADNKRIHVYGCPISTLGTYRVHLHFACPLAWGWWYRTSSLGRHRTSFCTKLHAGFSVLSFMRSIFIIIVM